MLLADAAVVFVQKLSSSIVFRPGVCCPIVFKVKAFDIPFTIFLESDAAHSDLLVSLRQNILSKFLMYIFEILEISGIQICFQNNQFSAQVF